MSAASARALPTLCLGEGPAGGPGDVFTGVLLARLALSGLQPAAVAAALGGGGLGGGGLRGRRRRAVGGA